MPARLISHYRIVRRLGAGGMGEVFLAQDTQLERPVALKVMSAELAKDPNQRKRFRTEAKAASGLTHPHICTIYEVGETEDGRPFLAMEYVEGQTIDVVLQERRLKLREAVSLGIEVAEALAAAHERGLVHRDIKPGNIMLDRRGGAKVLDFGLAKWFAPDELSGAITSVAHTRTGMLIGTPQYMSPEQALGRTLDPRSDIFSLGVVLYELGAGQRPFLGKTVGETINNIVNQPPGPLGLENRVFSPALDHIIFKCLEKDPEKRYTSAQELAADLRKLKEDSERALATATQEKTPAPMTAASGERQPTALWRLAAKAGASRNTALGWTICVVAVALLAVGWWLVRPRGGLQGSAKSAPRITSLAVKPLDDLSGETNQAYLSDGMTMYLSAALGNISTLSVRGQASVMRYKGGQKSIREMAKDLEVDAIVEGSILRASNRIQVSVRLIEAAKDRQLWGTNYNRDFSEFFVLQDEVARAIAAEIQVRLTPEDQARLARARTAKPEAIEAYLRGCIWSDQGTAEGFTNAVSLFQQAIALDPGYALAYAGLADANNMVADFLLGPQAAAEAARKNAETALRLDATLAQPHVALSFIKGGFEWDHAGAKQECERALTLAPNLADAHRAYGYHQIRMKQFGEARRALRRAWQLDPLSPVMNDGLAHVEFYARDFPKALDLCRATVAQFPESIWGHFRLAWVSEQLGLHEEAISAMTRARTIEDGPDFLARHAHIYASAGQPAMSLDLLRQLEGWQRRAYVAPTLFAWIHLGLGQTNEAIARLQEAVELRDGFLPGLNSDPYYDPIRTDPRFVELLRKIGLPP